MKWEKVKLGDICKYVTSGGTPKSSIKEYYEPKQIPWLKTKEVNYCRIYETESYISKDGLDNSSAKMIPQNSVIVAMYGQGDTAGRVAINKIPLTTNQACCNLIIDETKACYEFVYYQLVTLYEKMVSLKNGGAQPNLNAAIIKSMEIKLPPLKTQRYIADILSSYDNLIENNQKQIKLLEEATQRLYKEWFVDLRFPGHENTKIVDGLPEGWQYEKLGDLVKTTSGGTPSRRKSEYYVNGNIRWIKTKELNDRFIFETEEHITEDAVKNSSAKVLPEGALIVAMYGATIGKIGITAAEMACNQACCAFISFDDMISKEYLYCWLMDNREYLVSQGKGAAQSNLSQEMIRNFSLLCPDKKVIKNFTEIVTTMLENKRVLENKILMLSKARDDLLPKLMSEEVEV
jgi:type I restriction enzyme S subunit